MLQGYCKSIVCLEHQISISGTWNLWQEVYFYSPNLCMGPAGERNCMEWASQDLAHTQNSDTNAHACRDSVILEYVYVYRWTEKFSRCFTGMWMRLQTCEYFVTNYVFVNMYVCGNMLAYWLCIIFIKHFPCMCVHVWMIARMRACVDWWWITWW